MACAQSPRFHTISWHLISSIRVCSFFLKAKLASKTPEITKKAPSLPLKPNFSLRISQPITMAIIGETYVHVDGKKGLVFLINQKKRLLANIEATKIKYNKIKFLYFPVFYVCIVEANRLALLKSHR